MLNKAVIQKYSDWAGRLIIGILLFMLTVAYNSNKEQQRVIENKLDKVEFKEHCKDNDLRFKELEHKQSEQLQILIEIRNDVKWLKSTSK
jgi:hypothetical protein